MPGHARMKSKLRRDYNMLIWKYLKAHPELLKDKKLYSETAWPHVILAEVRLKAYPQPKRKGWIYTAWLKEINVFIDNWYEMNMEYALWGKNPLKVIPKDSDIY